MEDTESTKLFKTSIDLGNGESRQVGEAANLAHSMPASTPISQILLLCSRRMPGGEVTMAQV